jgi:hypothetical protein
MRSFYLVLALIISATTYGGSRMPCQYIDFDELVDGGLPPSDMLARDQIIADKFRKQHIALLQQCIEKYSVCIVEMPPKVSTWFNRKLKLPVDDNFDPTERDLAFGLVQYIDKETGNQICTIANNNFMQAVPWYGFSWVIGNGLIKKYELFDAQFKIAMTPKSLYDALLASHMRAVKYNRWIKSYNFTEPKD